MSIFIRFLFSDLWSQHRFRRFCYDGDQRRETEVRSRNPMKKGCTGTIDSSSSDLQSRLIVSHCAGVGESLTIEHARMMFALRINILAKGYSGISKETLEKSVAAFNSKSSPDHLSQSHLPISFHSESCIPEIPSQGTVGASGDLAPLAHLAAGLMGIGRMWSPKTGWGYAEEVLEKNGLTPIVYKAKEVWNPF